jgi:peptidoglycan/xylan/chitin deacetylase (PgdA/CDA1 family)
VARPAEVPDPAADQAVPVLMYHHIMPDPSNSIAISPATFDAQMSYLHGHGWHPISMAQLRAFVQTGKRLPSKPVLITFDDDRKNQLTYGVPILKKYGFTATFFVPKKWVAGPSPSFMHVSQLKQLIADGYDVESHTADHALIHPAKSRSTGIMESYASMKARYWEPVHGMRVWMDSTLGAPATALAYPGGMYNDDAIRLVRDAGYDLAFTTDDGYVTYKGQSPYALPRWNTGARGTTLARFVSILDRAERHKRAK